MWGLQSPLVTEISDKRKGGSGVRGKCPPWFHSHANAAVTADALTSHCLPLEVGHLAHERPHDPNLATRGQTYWTALLSKNPTAWSPRSLLKRLQGAVKHKCEKFWSGLHVAVEMAIYQTLRVFFLFTKMTENFWKISKTCIFNDRAISKTILVKFQSKRKSQKIPPRGKTNHLSSFSVRVSSKKPIPYSQKISLSYKKLQAALFDDYIWIWHPNKQADFLTHWTPAICTIVRPSTN